MSAALHVRELHAYYGDSHVLRGIDLTVRPGEIVALMGRNGAGRSTLAKAIMGLIKASGEVRLGNENLAGAPTHVVARRGIGYVPETRDIFPDLTVNENLTLGIRRRGREPSWTIEEFLDRFPNLARRRTTPAGALSGGEQQMLTLCRSLLGEPDIILIDEPTEGLAPQFVEETRALILDTRRRGAGVLLIEQKLAIALDICDRFCVIGAGRIVFEGDRDSFAGAEKVRAEWLGV